jgi:hypothetical protein
VFSGTASPFASASGASAVAWTLFNSISNNNVAYGGISSEAPSLP